MNRTVIKVLRLVLAGVLVTALAVVLWRQVEYARAEEDYEQAAKLAGLPEAGSSAPAVPAASEEPTEKPSESSSEEVRPSEPVGIPLEEVDLAALKQVNSDVVGWISIPDTELSYPLLQGTDNQYYLNHTWRKKSNGMGAIYLDYHFDPGLTDFYAIIYGHRMHNASMFGSLARYEKQEYWSKHPSVYLVLQEGVVRYDIFAAFEAGVQSDIYRLGFSQTEDREAFVSWCLEQSVIDTGLVPSPNGRIITLSTCTESGGAATRWVVLAALAEDDPAPSEQPEA